MLVAGIVLFALAILGLWLCLPGRNSEKKPFLRGGADIFAAIAVTGCVGVGIIVFVAGLAE